MFHRLKIAKNVSYRQGETRSGPVIRYYSREPFRRVVNIPPLYMSCTPSCSDGPSVALSPAGTSAGLRSTTYRVTACLGDIINELSYVRS